MKKHPSYDSWEGWRVRYDLKAEVSPTGHRWASRGVMRALFNFITQTPMWLWLLMCSLGSFGFIALLNALLCALKR